MKHRAHDPIRLDVAAFAADGGELNGTCTGTELPRLAQCQSPPQDMVPSDVQWHADGKRRMLPAGDAQVWLHLRAQTSAWLTCQRCLQRFQFDLAIDQQLRFVRDEQEAELLDADAEEDILALRRWLDLRELIEDELLLALPLVPRHGQCPQPLLPLHQAESELGESVHANDAATEGTRPNPFAVLGGLKVRRGPSGAQ